VANGKGSLTCLHCRFRAYPRCQYHDVVLPEGRNGCSTICVNFESSDVYWEHKGPHCPPARRFAWFGCDLEPGVLYEFFYNAPEAMTKLAVLRTPDYESGSWKPSALVYLSE
jgi:hypothetical protein